MNTEITTTNAGSSGIRLNTLADLSQFAGILMKSGLAPSGFKSTEAVIIALQLGSELGLSPMAAMQNIAVINGRPSLWGDAQLAVCRATGQLAGFEEYFTQAGTRIEGNPVTFDDGTAAMCVVTRRGYPPATSSFSVADAKRAGLWGKAGPWQQFPGRMLKSRARAFCLRDQFGDALRGLMTTDEAADIPAEAPRQAHGRVVEPQHIDDGRAVTKKQAPPMSEERKAKLADLRAAYQDAGLVDGNAAEALLRKVGLLTPDKHVTDLSDVDLDAAWTVRFEVFPPLDQ